MKLIVAIVNQDDAPQVARGLSEGGFMSTRFASRGGYLDRENVTFVVGAADDAVSQVKQIIRHHVHRRETAYVPPQPEYAGYAAVEEEPVVVSGATLFVLDAQQFERI